MAQKRITDLQLKDDVGADISIPSDDGIQSYRITTGQLKDFILAAAGVTRDKIEEKERLPIGTVLPFAGTTAPTGFIVCDGSALSRTTYADLFAVIGTSHGQADGSTTFLIPDYRGRFLRMVSNGQTRDPDKATRTAMATGGATGDSVGSVQNDAFQGHRHTISAPSIKSSAGAFEDSVPSGNGSAPTGSLTIGAPSTLSSGTPRISNETRPINAYVNYIIKY